MTTKTKENKQIMSTPAVVGNTEFKYEKSTLNVSFLWKLKGHNFIEFLDFNDRCENKTISTDEIRFFTGFLASTNHYVKCYIITSYLYSMFVKVYMEDTELSSEFTNSEVSPSKVNLKFGDDCRDAMSCNTLPDNTKNDLVSKGYFAKEDFVSQKHSNVYWFFSDGKYYDQKKQQWTTMKSLERDTIFCNFEFDYCFWNKSKSTMEVAIPEDDADLTSATENKGKEFSAKEFLFSSKFSDFIIQCGPKSFYAHRVIITLKSPVLATMLEQEMKEAKEGKLVIDDFEPEAVEQLLRYIYTESANVDAYAAELFQLSHKYGLSDLNRLSETALITKLDKANLIHVNELGKLYNSKKLQDRCYSFFKYHRSSLLKTKSDVEKLSDFVLRFTSE